jgi:hypothetical protein
VTPRIVAAEVLDGLAEDDPAAMRSRRDLRRVHRAMGTRAIVVRALKEMTASWLKTPPRRVLELGAGDGSLMLAIARALAPRWPQVQLTLLDAQGLVDSTTLRAFAALGWTVTSDITDVFDWAARPVDDVASGGAAPHWDLILTNLFLHHFEGEQLASLLAAIAARGERFFACEPRRARLALAGSHLIGAIGAGPVTREDAVLSVRAGFRGNELTAQWPAVGDEWETQEYSAGLFSHCFRAEPIGQN